MQGSDIGIVDDDPLNRASKFGDGVVESLAQPFLKDLKLFFGVYAEFLECLNFFLELLVKLMD